MRFANPPLKPHYPGDDHRLQHHQGGTTTTPSVVVTANTNHIIDREEAFLKRQQQLTRTGTNKKEYSLSTSLLVAVILCLIFHFFIFSSFCENSLKEEVDLSHPLHWNHLSLKHQDQIEEEENKNINSNKYHQRTRNSDEVADDEDEKDDPENDNDDDDDSSLVFSRSHARVFGSGSSSASKRRRKQLLRRHHRLPFSTLSIFEDEREKLATSVVSSSMSSESFLGNLSSILLSNSVPKLQDWNDLIFVPEHEEREENRDKMPMRNSQDSNKHTSTTTCIGWKQTGHCNSESGPREPHLDKSCHTEIDLFPSSASSSLISTISGYCQCARIYSSSTSTTKYSNHQHEKPSRIEYFQEGHFDCPEKFDDDEDETDQEGSEILNINLLKKFTCAQLCSSSSSSKELHNLKRKMEARTLDRREKNFFTEKFYRIRGLLGNNDDREEEDQNLNSFLKQALVRRNAQKLDKKVHRELSPDEEGDLKKYFTQVDDFASKRAHLFRKIRYIRHRRRLHKQQEQQLHNNNKNENDNGNKNNDNAYEEDLLQIERMVAGGFAGSQVDEAFERDVDERVRKSLE